MRDAKHVWGDVTGLFKSCDFSARDGATIESAIRLTLVSLPNYFFQIFQKVNTLFKVFLQYSSADNDSKLNFKQKC